MPTFLFFFDVDNTLKMRLFMNLWTNITMGKGVYSVDTLYKVLPLESFKEMSPLISDTYLADSRPNLLIPFHVRDR
jgi:hypothetical protein